MDKKMVLYHYYDRKTGPFKNLSDISIDEAEKILQKIIDEIGYLPIGEQEVKMFFQLINILIHHSAIVTILGNSYRIATALSKISDKNN